MSDSIDFTFYNRQWTAWYVLTEDQTRFQIRLSTTQRPFPTREQYRAAKAYAASLLRNPRHAYSGST